MPYEPFSQDEHDQAVEFGCLLLVGTAIVIIVVIMLTM